MDEEYYSGGGRDWEGTGEAPMVRLVADQRAQLLS